MQLMVISVEDDCTGGGPQQPGSQEQNGSFPEHKAAHGNPEAVRRKYCVNNMLYKP